MLNPGRSGRCISQANAHREGRHEFAEPGFRVREAPVRVHTKILFRCPGATFPVTTLLPGLAPGAVRLTSLERWANWE